MAYTCETVTPKSAPIAVFMAGATEKGDLGFAATKGDIKTGYYLATNRMLMNMIDVVNYNKEEKIVYTSSEIECKWLTWFRMTTCVSLSALRI
jgi:hypothetical protein